MVRPPPKSTRTDTLFPYTTLFRSLGQTIIVDNKAGANGNIATSFVARAAPDGYTLFVTSIGHAVNPAMYKNVTYNPVKDFTPIGQVLTAPNVMVVPKSSPFNNVKELIDYAKKNPGVLNVAASGVGTSVPLSAVIGRPPGREGGCTDG